MIISFDFDGTLCWTNKKNISIFRRNIKLFNILIKHLKNKDEVIIVTFRNQDKEIEECIVKNICRREIFESDESEAARKIALKLNRKFTK